MPHFFILHKKDGITEDYSIDEEKSPKVTLYPTFPFNGEEKCGVFDPIRMTLVIRDMVCEQNGAFSHNFLLSL